MPVLEALARLLATRSSPSSPVPTRRPGAAARSSPSPGRGCAPRRSGIEVLTPGAPGDPGFLDAAARAGPRRLPRRRLRRAWSRRPSLAVPPHGWVNLHFSLLPAWRGAAPVQHAIMAGDEVTGATTFRLEEGLDTGPTYGVMTETIRPTDTAGDLLAGCRRPAPGCWWRRSTACRRHAAGRAAAGRRGLARPQDHRRRRAGRLDRTRARRRPADPRLHPRARAPGPRSAASGSSWRRWPAVADGPAAGPGEIVARPALGPRRHRHRRRSGWAGAAPRQEADGRRRLGPRRPARAEARGSAMTDRHQPGRGPRRPLRRGALAADALDRPGPPGGLRRDARRRRADAYANLVLPRAAARAAGSTGATPASPPS